MDLRRDNPGRCRYTVILVACLRKLTPEYRGSAFAGRRSDPAPVLALSQAAFGKVNQKVLPRPEPSDSTQIFPPCTSTMRFTSANPTPVPPTSALNLSNRPYLLLEPGIYSDAIIFYIATDRPVSFNCADMDRW